MYICPRGFYKAWISRSGQTATASYLLSASPLWGISWSDRLDRTCASVLWSHIHWWLGSCIQYSLQSNTDMVTQEPYSPHWPRSRLKCPSISITIGLYVCSLICSHTQTTAGLWWMALWEPSTTYWSSFQKKSNTAVCTGRNLPIQGADSKLGFQAHSIFKAHHHFLCCVTYYLFPEALRARADLTPHLPGGCHLSSLSCFGYHRARRWDFLLCFLLSVTSCR